MRVVAGTCGGRLLVAPPGRRTRPTSDRVRGAVANALDSLGVIDRAVLADVFAGSGALGIEALSRGAAHCTFVESAPAALRALRHNLEGLGLTDRASVVAADALRWATGGVGPFDLALVDPPYTFADWPALLARLRAELVVAEAAHPVSAPGWVAVRERAYGGTVVTFLRPAGPSPAG